MSSAPICRARCIVESSLPAPIAAVIPDGLADPDEIVAGFAVSQINRGRRISGLVQEIRSSHRTKQITLVDLDDGCIYPISQDLGTHSVSCRLDPCGIAEATIVMRRIALHGADLAIFNRYSALEAKGGGFAAEMLDLMARRIPVLTIVPRQHLEAWRKFTGGLSVEMAPSRPVLEKWFADICQPLTREGQVGTPEEAMPWHGSELEYSR